MVEMNALERQLAEESLRIVGPEPVVDDAAIFAAITATQSPKWRFQTMFSATKFVVAGAIVALFGAFLLSGILTQQPSDEPLPPPAASASASAEAEPSDAATSEPELTPETEADGTTVTPDLLPGVDLVTEEVEPGVYRVLSDGAGHDLVAEPPASVTVAPDGSIWLLQSSDDPVEGITMDPNHGVDAVFQLGRDGTDQFEPSSSDFIDLAVDTDGAAWVSIGPELQDGPWGYSSAQGSLSSVDDGTWATPTWLDGSADVGAIEATADGTVWVARNVEDGPGPSVARIKDGESRMLPPLEDPSLEGHYGSSHASFVAAEDGTAWLANGGAPERAPGPTGLLHFDGERWEVVDLPIVGRRVRAGPLALGPDGTLWVYTSQTAASHTISHLARLDDDGWTVFSGRSDGNGHALDQGDGVPILSTRIYYEARMAVDPDGRLWIAVSGDGGGYDRNWLYPPSLDLAPGPVGLLMFDGTRWNQYLRGLHVNRVVVADDGSVFATVHNGCSSDGCNIRNMDWGLGGLYVITPEAVAE